MSSNKSFNKATVPFYALPSKRRSSAEIIKEAKIELKMMEAKRPPTPFKRNRSYDALHNNSRPTSSISLLSFKKSPPEKQRPVSCVKLQPIQTEKVNQKEKFELLNLEPIVTKTPLIDRKTNQKVYATKSETSISSFPPISEQDNRIYAKTDVNSKSDVESSSHLPEKPSQTERNAYSDDCITIQNIISVNCENVHKKDLDTSLNNDKKLPSGDNVNREIPNSIHVIDLEKFSNDIDYIISKLEKIIHDGRTYNENLSVMEIEKLNKLLETADMMNKPFEQRIYLFKLLFKLLDSQVPTLSLHTCRLVLDMKISEKNLANICKLLWKICRDEENYITILDCHILDAFMKNFETVSVQSNPEAIKYSIAALNSLMSNDLLLDILISFDLPSILLSNLKELNSINGSTKVNSNVIFEEEDNKHELYASIVVELFTAFLCLTEKESAWSFIACQETLEQLLILLSKYKGSEEVVLRSVALLSKIADSTQGSQALSTCENICDVLLPVTIHYRLNLGIIAHATFVIGNLISHDNSLSLCFHASSGFMNVLYSLLNNQKNPELQRKKKMYKNDFFHEECSKESNTNSYEDVIQQTVRILANMCLNHDVGKAISEDGEGVISLLNLADAYTYSDSDNDDICQLLMCILVTVNNISFFLNDDIEALNPNLPVRIIKSVVPLLDEACLPSIRIEAFNIVQNLIRLSGVRSYIYENKLIPAFITLLNENDRKMIAAAYSLMMNLLLYKPAREIFYKEHGVSKILHKLHLCLSRDWNTAALVCQVLWNYCGGEETMSLPLKHIEAQHLIKVLQYATGKDIMLKTDSPEIQKAWDADFYPAATKLLHVLQTTKTVFS